MLTALVDDAAHDVVGHQGSRTGGWPMLTGRRRQPLTHDRKL